MQSGRTQSSGLGATSWVKKLVVARSMTEPSMGKANQSHRGDVVAARCSGCSRAGTSRALEVCASQAQRAHDRMKNAKRVPHSQLCVLSRNCGSNSIG